MKLSFVRLVFAVSLFATIGFAQSSLASAAGSNDLRMGFTGEYQKVAKPPTTSWPKNGGDLFNQNYSPLAQVNRQNVATLKGVWRTRLDASGMNAKYSGEAQPVVEDGVIYIVTGADDVFAINVDTGRILWKHEAKLAGTISTVCCGWTSRGVALGEGKVYVAQLDDRLVALDQQSGRVEWSTETERWQGGHTITAAPLYYDGMVIAGFAGGENGMRGRVKAYDAKSGRLLWTFYTIPGPGELGHDTWPKDTDAWKHGGASVWQTPAVDPELGLIYFSTGNPGPDFNGQIRPGDNLFSDCIIALEARTGKYRWHFQQVHHDIWDYDSPNPVILFDVKINGRVRKAVAEASKTGWVYILDRVTGRPLLGIDEKPVPQDSRQRTSPTQPFPRGDSFVPQQIDIAPEGFVLINKGRIFTPFWTESVPAKPSTRGGANWPPSSYDPTTNYLYLCGSDQVGLFKGGEEIAALPGAGERYLGGTFGSIAGGGVFAALDMKTNRIVWKQAWKDSCYSGSVSTAGGLVFVGRNDGRLTALNASTGERMWEFQTGAGMNAPASVFEYEGQQYIVAYSAGNRFAGTPRGDSVWLFSLKGTMEQVAPAPIAPIIASAPVTTADLTNGQKIFNRMCSGCHGGYGEGGHGGGPSLTSIRDVARIAQIVQQGGAQMPSFGSSLTAKDIQDVTAYIRQKVMR